jgi:quinol monooxygenase YgiN
VLALASRQLPLGMAGDYPVTLIGPPCRPFRPADRFGAVPDLPWTVRAEMEPGTGYLVMASHLPLKRITATVRFFRGVFAVRKQLAAADGLIGYTLRAKPLARDYWTLSVWKDNTALRAFMRTPPHVQLMTSLKPLMGPTKFVTWTISAADGRPSMAGALEHLASG